MRVIILLFGFLPLFALAGEARDLAKDPVVEKRMVGLAENLRCLVCQNESLARACSEKLVVQESEAGSGAFEMVSTILRMTTPSGWSYAEKRVNRIRSAAMRLLFRSTARLHGLSRNFVPPDPWGTP